MGVNHNGRLLPLNDFQQLMLQWNEHQPFHVVDVVEVTRSVDAARLQAAAEAELAAVGIFHPVPDLVNQSVMYGDGPAQAPVQVITPAKPENYQAALEDQCAAELKQRFQPGVDPFFRLWVLRTAPHEHVGMTWQHWPCDGYAAADLFRRILARYFGLAIDDQKAITDCTPADMTAAFRSFQGFGRRLARVHKTVREMFRITRAYVAPRPSDPQTPLEIHFVDLPHDVLAGIQARARRNDATVNDVIAAAVMRALTTTVPAGNWWKRRISLSNIVDLRQNAPELLGRKWGLFLGFCIFDCMGPTQQQDELVQQVRAQSQRTKTSRGYLASLKAMGLSRRLWHWLPRKHRWSLSRCLGSFSAVLSNLRLPTAWFPPPWDQEIQCYWRMLPLGSIVPLSVAVTTFNSRLTLTLTTESNSFCAQRIDELKKLIAQELV